jgi:hypothetical protein
MNPSLLPIGGVDSVLVYVMSEGFDHEVAVDFLLGPWEKVSYRSQNLPNTGEDSGVERKRGYSQPSVHGWLKSFV